MTVKYVTAFRECPHCGAPQSVVCDSRPVETKIAGVTIKRRRRCEKCAQRWTTYEVSDIGLQKLQMQAAIGRRLLEHRQEIVNWYDELLKQFGLNPDDEDNEKRVA